MKTKKVKIEETDPDDLFIEQYLTLIIIINKRRLKEENKFESGLLEYLKLSQYFKHGCQK